MENKMMEIEMYQSKRNKYKIAFWTILAIVIAGILFLQFRGLENVWRRGYRDGFVKGATNGFQVGIDTGRGKNCEKMAECSGLWSIQMDLQTLEAKWVNKNTGEGYVFPYGDYPYSEHDK